MSSTVDLRSDTVTRPSAAMRRTMAVAELGDDLFGVDPTVNRPDGTLDLAEVEAAIKPDDPHFARTRLFALENTIGGKAIARPYFENAIQLAKRKNLSTHLDGARIFNAAVKLGVPAAELCRGFASGSV